MSTLGKQEALEASARGEWELIGRDMIRTKRTEAGGGEIVAQFWTAPSPEHARLMVAAPKMLAALKAIQWSGTADLEEGGAVPCCPWCEALQAENGHVVGCQVSTAIAAAEASHA